MHRAAVSSAPAQSHGEVPYAHVDPQHRMQAGRADISPVGRIETMSPISVTDQVIFAKVADPRRKDESAVRRVPPDAALPTRRVPRGLAKFGPSIPQRNHAPAPLQAAPPTQPAYPQASNFDDISLAHYQAARATPRGTTAAHPPASQYGYPPSMPPASAGQDGEAPEAEGEEDEEGYWSLPGGGDAQSQAAGAPAGVWGAPPTGPPPPGIPMGVAATPANDEFRPEKERALKNAWLSIYDQLQVQEGVRFSQPLTVDNTLEDIIFNVRAMQNTIRVKKRVNGMRRNLRMPAEFLKYTADAFLGDFIDLDGEREDGINFLDEWDDVIEENNQLLQIICRGNAAVDHVPSKAEAWAMLGRSLGSALLSTINRNSGGTLVAKAAERMWGPLKKRRNRSKAATASAPPPPAPAAPPQYADAQPSGPWFAYSPGGVQPPFQTPTAAASPYPHPTDPQVAAPQAPVAPATGSQYQTPAPFSQVPGASQAKAAVYPTETPTGLPPGVAPRRKRVFAGGMPVSPVTMLMQPAPQ